MSRPFWQSQLRKKLASLSLSRPDGDRLRVAVVGIGHALNGDDGAGIAVAQALTARLTTPTLLVLDAGAAPENQTGALRRFDPALVLFVDAANMGGAPGEVRLLDWQDTTGLSASTHTLPLHVIAQYLVHELGCDVALLGIQPQQNAVMAPLSPLIEGVVREVVSELADALTGPVSAH
jgi:hydrogenase 3 maturation protease